MMGVAGKQGRRTRGKLNPFEWFMPAVGGTESAQIGAWSGYLLNGDGEYAYISLHLPYNFARLEELVVLLIPNATLDPMYMRVLTDYAQNGEAYFQHNDQVNPKQVTTVQNRMVELDIKDVVDVAPVEAGDYIGIQVARLAGQDPAHNTNAYVIGARCKALIAQGQ